MFKQNTFGGQENFTWVVANKFNEYSERVVHRCNTLLFLNAQGSVVRGAGCSEGADRWKCDFVGFSQTYTPWQGRHFRWHLHHRDNLSYLHNDCKNNVLFAFQSFDVKISSWSSTPPASGAHSLAVRCGHVRITNNGYSHVLGIRAQSLRTT